MNHMITRKCRNAHCERDTPEFRSGVKPFVYCAPCRKIQITAIARRNMRRRRGLSGAGTARGAILRQVQPSVASVSPGRSWWLESPRGGFTASAADRAPQMSASRLAVVVGQMDLARGLWW